MIDNVLPTLERHGDMTWKFGQNVDMETGVISQHVLDICGGLTHWVVNTREQAVKDALIKLGWTPPPPIKPDNPLPQA